MPQASRYRPSNFRFFNRLLRLSYGAWLRHAFRIRVRGAELFEDLRPPYVVVPNHACVLDPFMVGALVPAPVYWVTSDGNMRTRLMRFLLRLVGSIPKSKAIPDLETVGMMVEVIRRRRGVVGVFAEGQACWDGSTQAIFSGTAKLLKLLKVPTVVALVKGSFLSLPRWSWHRRRGEMEIEFKLVYAARDLKALDAEAIHAGLEAALRHDEYAWIAGRPTVWSGRAPAEHLELALFLCPECEAVGALRSQGHEFRCSACGASARLNRRGGFVRPAGGRGFRFATIGEWDRWQAGAFRTWLSLRVPHPERPLFGDSGVALLRGRRMNPLRRVRTGRLVLYPDRIELEPLVGAHLVFPLAGLSGAGTLKQHTFEFYEGKALYQIRFAHRHSSGRKWQAAVETLAALRGESLGDGAGRALRAAAT